MGLSIFDSSMSWIWISTKIWSQITGGQNHFRMMPAPFSFSHRDWNVLLIKSADFSIILYTTGKGKKKIELVHKYWSWGPGCVDTEWPRSKTRCKMFYTCPNLTAFRGSWKHIAFIVQKLICSNKDSRNPWSL